MADWRTYRLHDFLLFSARTYYRVAEHYNRDIWPLQLLALAAGVSILILAVRRSSPRVVAALLAAAWIWTGWEYELKRYATINWAARGFGVAFFVEAALLIVVGVLLDGFQMKVDPFAIGMFAFALVVEPSIAVVAGRPWPAVEIFGVGPDPTAVATLAVLLLARQRLLTVIPILWCAISGATLWTLQERDALLLPAAAIVAAVMMLRRRSDLP